MFCWLDKSTNKNFYVYAIFLMFLFLFLQWQNTHIHKQLWFDKANMGRKGHLHYKNSYLISRMYTLTLPRLLYRSSSVHILLTLEFLLPVSHHYQTQWFESLAPNEALHLRIQKPTVWLVLGHWKQIGQWAVVSMEETHRHNEEEISLCPWDLGQGYLSLGNCTLVSYHEYE